MLIEQSKKTGETSFRVFPDAEYFPGTNRIILEDNYNDIIDMIDDKIAYEATRVANYESEMRRKFSALEATLGIYENIKTTLASQIEELNKE
jgi:hypothetical protein